MMAHAANLFQGAHVPPAAGRGAEAFGCHTPSELCHVHALCRPSAISCNAWSESCTQRCAVSRHRWGHVRAGGGVSFMMHVLLARALRFGFLDMRAWFTG